MARPLAILVFLTFAMAALARLMPISGSALAGVATTPASAPGGPPPGPPPEAIEACKGKAEGATVNFAGRNGESFKGVCQLMNGVLAARPLGGPGGGTGGPPPPH